MERKPVAFMSYTRFDDEYTDGALTRFREELERTLLFLSGRDIEIFQDVEGISVGQNIRERITHSLNDIIVLIPIITPKYFQDDGCREELELFLAREDQLGRNDLIFWVYYQTVPKLEAMKQHSDRSSLPPDTLLSELAPRKGCDWRPLRDHDLKAPQARAELERIAERIISVWNDLEASPPPEPPHDDHTRDTALPPHEPHSTATYLRESGIHPTKHFDPTKFIDREFEQTLFKELLTCTNHARILAIGDRSGMGKSHLLERFHYHCRTVRPRTPVSLVDLKQLPDLSPTPFVKAIVKDLSAFGVSFPAFTRHESARQAADFKTIHTALQFEEVAFSYTPSGGPVAISRRETRTLQLTPEQEETAQQVCLRSFFDDLKQHCARQSHPVVLMIDSYERCQDDRLRTWLLGYFFERYCFDLSQRPERLLLVVAG